MAPLPAPGCAAAHDDMVAAFVQWRLKQQACEAMPLDALQAAYADEAWAELRRHAVNCGWDVLSGPLSAWAPRRIRAYGRSVGVSELEIGVVIGPDAGGPPYDGVSVKQRAA